VNAVKTDDDAIVGNERQWNQAWDGWDSNSFRADSAVIVVKVSTRPRATG